MTSELKVTAADAGERLDAFLAGPLGSRARAQRLIDGGQVRVDGTARPKRHRLRGGEGVAGGGGAAPAPRHPAAPTPPPCPRRGPPAPPADPIRGARASSIAWTAAPRGCWSWRSPR